MEGTGFCAGLHKDVQGFRRLKIEKKVVPGQKTIN